jgi:DNA-binding NarL/FixJ family response regulator
MIAGTSLLSPRCTPSSTAVRIRPGSATRPQVQREVTIERREQADPAPIGGRGGDDVIELGDDLVDVACVRHASFLIPRYLVGAPRACLKVGAEAGRDDQRVNRDVGERSPDAGGRDQRQRRAHLDVLDVGARHEGIRAGARGYLRKDVRLEDLVGAIRVLARGETLIQPALTDRIRRGFAAHPAAREPGAPVDPQIERLTARELEVLRLMFGGYSNREIADACGVVEGTIKTHVSNILAKLGVRDRTRAVLRALEIGLL